MAVEAWMLLHGHTRASIDAMSFRDFSSVLALCRSGLMGPLAIHAGLYRVASHVHELKRTVASLVKPGATEIMTMSRDWPELAPFADDAGDGRRGKVVRGQAAINAHFHKLITGSRPKR